MSNEWCKPPAVVRKVMLNRDHRRGGESSSGTVLSEEDGVATVQWDDGTVGSVDSRNLSSKRRSGECD
jgi:hypothetical protein